MEISKKQLLRKRILNACIGKLQLLIDDFTTRIKNIMTHDGLGNEEEYDNSALAQDSQGYAEVNALNQSLSFVTSDMNVLRYLSTLTDTIHETPERGAIVTTDHGNYFVCVSAGQITEDGEIYTTLSTHSQLFLMMKGKRAGQSFEFNRIKYRIKEIF